MHFDGAISGTHSAGTRIKWGIDLSRFFLSRFVGHVLLTDIYHTIRRDEAHAKRVVKRNEKCSVYSPNSLVWSDINVVDSKSDYGFLVLLPYLG